MSSGGPEGGDKSSDQSIKNSWLAAQNLSIGDSVILNWEFVFEIKRMNQDDSIIEYLGKLRDEDNKWRVLRVNTERMGSLGFFPTDMSKRVGIVDIAPVAETILSTETSASLLPSDVIGEISSDSYINERNPGVEFSNDVDIEGDCPCGGDIGIVGTMALCDACGRWVPAEVWHAWREVSPNETDDDSTTDSLTEREDSGNRSLEDFS